jgi:uncharacterized lipoprotein YddW (UPF0748 family)
LALASLALFALLIRPLAAQPLPPDPLAFAAKVGLNQAWYVEHGYPATAISPAHFPSPLPAARTIQSPTLDHHVYLPLVQSGGTVTEARALWVTRWDYNTITDVQTLVANAAGAGFNMLLFQVRGTADAFYTPGLEPWAARLSGALGQDPGWDPLQTAIEAAHAHGLELHAYLNVYTVWVGAAPPPTDTAPAHLFWTLTERYTDTWRPVDISGVTMTLTDTAYLWATPALTDVAGHVISVTADLATRYDVDGVHLDLLRYPGRDYSYDPFSDAGYEAALTQEPGLERAEWQRQQVTLLVNRVYSEAISLRPELRLSAAVWPVYQDRWGWGYSEGYGDYYQDSQGWVLSGAIDAIMPMLYPANVIANPDFFTPTQFSLLASDFLTHTGGRHVFPGISAQYADFEEIAQRIAIARDLGAPGHAIFSARLVANNEYWDEFAAGPYATLAAVPPVAWQQQRQLALSND